MKFTYYGHSCFCVEAGGKQLLFDPFISGNEHAKHIDIDRIPADYIFVSHGHFDHMLDVTRIAGRTGAKVLGGWELYNHFIDQGISNSHPINPGGIFEADFGSVKAVSAVHSSSFSDGRYAGVAQGFIVKTGDGNFYYSGDTTITMDMAYIPKWAALNFAILPIGGSLTMGVEDAMAVAGLVEVKDVIGVHYDTFGFIKIDREETSLAFEKAGLRVHLPPIGASIDL